MSPEEIEKHYTKCEFNDACDFCKDPQEGSYADISTTENGTETNFYVCGKCAPDVIQAEIERIEFLGDAMAADYAKEQEELNATNNT